MDQSFRGGQDRGPSADTLGGIGAAAVAFLDALARREPCALPRAAEALPPPAPQPAQQPAGAPGKLLSSARVTLCSTGSLLGDGECHTPDVIQAESMDCQPCL